LGGVSYSIEVSDNVNLVVADPIKLSSAANNKLTMANELKSLQNIPGNGYAPSESFLLRVKNKQHPIATSSKIALATVQVATAIVRLRRCLSPVHKARKLEDNLFVPYSTSFLGQCY
jgi:hypothetical protein